MKKVLALMLALVMLLAFVGCGDEEPAKDGKAADASVAEDIAPEVEEEVEVDEPNPALVEYLEANPMEDENATVEVEGNGFVITYTNATGLASDITEEELAEGQAMFDEMAPELLAQIQTEVPECEFLKIVVLDMNGVEVLSVLAD